VSLFDPQVNINRPIRRASISVTIAIARVIRHLSE
jgi:hypothetical protein